ncbi:hypothetical protein [Brenneria tiliae]|uniref:Uncharacterized protein n=1 Tax=Brenneria tiliae TaxID=2914984 RepID=A0ABT0MUP9_9GAMM|nr:hypothetical protein [Brenneria tiliae]MCL2893580.1 hypothetical protein [Brenneria tiliae]
MSKNQNQRDLAKTVYFVHRRPDIVGYAGRRLFKSALMTGGDALNSGVLQHI